MAADRPSTNALPRLLVASDVLVERTTAGDLLLYRLLGGYPSERLCIAYGDLLVTRPELRLPGRAYVAVRSTLGGRLARTRFHRFWKIVQLLVAWFDPRLVRQLEKLADAHGMEAVLTVVHGSAWVAAARLARRRRWPLHLVVHDDLVATMDLPAWAMGLRRWIFGGVYRQAASRLCVSPGMAEQYGREFGVAGTVLYPSRGDDSPPPRRRSAQRVEGRELVLAYAGSLWISGYVQLLVALARQLEPLGGRIELYTPAGAAGDARQHGFDTGNVTFRAFLPPAELSERIAATATALFCPASFAGAERFTIEILFPSKLVDYSAMGLPVLIWGPAYSSAVRWAREFPDAAAVCVDPAGGDALRAVLTRLRDDPAWRDTLAEGALRAGEACFSLDAGRDILRRALTSP